MKKSVTKDQETKALDTTDGSAEALWFNVGYYIATDEEEMAIKTLENLIRSFPGDGGAFFLLGRTFFYRHEFEKAEYYLACSAELDSSNPEVAFLYGTCLAKNGHLQRSNAWLHAAADLMPDKPAAFFNLGLNYQALNEEEQAMKMFCKVIELDPQNMAAPFHVGMHLLLRNELARARHYFEKCLEIAPEFVPTWQQMLLICISQNDLDSAGMIARRGLDYNPQSSELIVDLAAFENFRKPEVEILPRVRKMLKDKKELVEKAMERISQFQHFHKVTSSIPTSLTIQ